jgi:hypothetical protein
MISEKQYQQKIDSLETQIYKITDENIFLKKSFLEIKDDLVKALDKIILLERVNTLLNVKAIKCDGLEKYNRKLLVKNVALWAKNEEITIENQELKNRIKLYER